MWCLQQCWTAASGLRRCLNRTMVQLELQIMNKPEQSIRVQSNWSPSIRLNWADCQLVVQWVHLQIHIMLLFLLLDNNFLPKLLIRHPVITFCKMCGLRYQLYWNSCITFYSLQICLSRQTLVLLWAGILRNALVTQYARQCIIDPPATIIFIKG